MSEAKGTGIYRAADAAADLIAAGLLSGILTPKGDPQGGFRGAGLDSRILEDGQLFVAMTGENVDGRNFIPAVLDKGHWVLADNNGWPGDRQLVLPAATGILLTHDAPAALGVLASVWRRGLTVQTAGVTGTNGKTTTKDLLAAMLQAAGPTLFTRGNFNNRLGLPLTLLGLRADHRFAVLEMGASAVGDIAGLAPLAMPRTAVITNAAPAHLAEFGSLEDIIQGKGEILDVLPGDGCAVLNADSPGFRRWRDRAPCPVVSFGQDQADFVWSWTPAGPGGGPEISLNGVTFKVPLPGPHNGANLAAAVLAARSFGLDDQVIAAGLDRFVGSAHRGVLLEMGGRIILDDCYNANPDSMVAAGTALGRLEGAGKPVAILGAMAELGPDSREIHEQTGRRLAKGPVEILIAVGENARGLTVGFDAGGGVGHYCDDLEAAAGLAARLTGPGDRLLIKGSRSAAMEELLPLLAAAFGADATNPRGTKGS